MKKAEQKASPNLNKGGWSRWATQTMI
jgi:hypothetical protein